MSDHLALMEENKSWFADLKWAASDEMRAMARLKPETREAVKETGYPAATALRLERQIGAPEAIKTIWSTYNATMREAYGQR